MVGLIMDKNSKSVRILDLLEAAGDEGMRFREIQHALWEMSNTKPFADKAAGIDNRGYWCTALLGGMHYHDGLLRVYADKGDDGRWRRNGREHEGKPWAKVNFNGSRRRWVYDT